MRSAVCRASSISLIFSAMQTKVRSFLGIDPFDEKQLMKGVFQKGAGISVSYFRFVFQSDDSDEVLLTYPTMPEQKVKWKSKRVKNIKIKQRIF
jgi:hypothetical protein